LPKKKKLRRRILIIAIFIAAALAAAGGGAAYKMNKEQSAMTPIETGEFLPGIYAVNEEGMVNCFFIKSGEVYIAVDAGFNADALSKGLEILGIPAGDVAAVLMTHTHQDHTGGLKLFKDADIYGANSAVASKAIADGDILEIAGRQITVIATPGHADDSVCFLVDGSILFAGDNLSLAGNKVGMFNSFYNKSDDQQRIDIERLSNLTGISYIITAHYGYTGNPEF